MGYQKVEKDARIEKVIVALRMAGKSEKTIVNYANAINRFLKYFAKKNISKLKEKHIIEYIQEAYLKKNCSVSTYNMNLSAIKFFYSVSFGKEFNEKLLPHAKSMKKLPQTLDKETFLKILNSEKSLKHKCWYIQ